MGKTSSIPTSGRLVFGLHFCDTGANRFDEVNVGGSGHDEMHVNIDVYNGEIFFAGHTGSGYPTTGGAFQSVTAGGSYDAFIGKITCKITHATTSYSDTTICLGDSVMLQAYGGGTYLWSPTTAMNNNVISNPTVAPINTTTYKVIVDDGCSVDSTNVTVNVINCPNSCIGNLVPNPSFVCDEIMVL